MDVKEKKMEESFKYHIPEDIPANERTAFHGAAAAAAKAGKKNFNFGGKTHPVTMKKDTAKAIADQKESTMSFREKLMSLYENDRAKHYKGATEPEGMHDKSKSSKGAMDMLNTPKTIEADGMKAAKDTAANIAKSAPGKKLRKGDNGKGDTSIIPSATKVNDPAAKTQTMESTINEKEHPHEEAIEDHQSHAREHKDNIYDNPKTSGKHHKAAYHAHMDAADHLEYNRTKEAKASAKKAVFHAKKAKELGGEDHTAETNRIFKKHHSSTNESYGISGNKVSDSLLDAIEAVVPEGSIKGSGTDRKAILKKAYRSGEDNTRAFYGAKKTIAAPKGMRDLKKYDAKHKDKGIEKAYNAGKHGDYSGNPAIKGKERMKPQSNLPLNKYQRQGIKMNKGK